jgi:hypothetical protein
MSILRHLPRAQWLRFSPAWHVTTSAGSITRLIHCQPRRRRACSRRLEPDHLFRYPSWAVTRKVRCRREYAPGQVNGARGVRADRPKFINQFIVPGEVAADADACVDRHRLGDTPGALDLLPQPLDASNVAWSTRTGVAWIPSSAKVRPRTRRARPRLWYYGPGCAVVCV